jgi:preprotein translocase subunit SecF
MISTDKQAIDWFLNHAVENVFPSRDALRERLMKGERLRVYYGIDPTGVYVILSHKYGAEVDTLFVIALLTIIGISISDKIVVFDRIRENLKLSGKKQSFDEIVGASLIQTFTRSINTSVTVILALLALFFFGPVMTKWFTLTLIVGMFVGTYSSIFVASPLLTVWNNMSRNK